MANIFPRNVLRRLKEMRFEGPSSLGLRNSLSALRSGFYTAPTDPALRDTKIDKDKARSIYFNTDLNLNNGAFLAKPIVDGIADYMGIPRFSVQDENIDDEINSWVNDYWKNEIWNIYRNCFREADTWVRLRKVFPGPLLAPDEENVVIIEVIDTDRVTPYYNPATNQLERVEILTRVYIEDQPYDPRQIYATGTHTHGREHEIIEIIEPNEFTYYDATNARIIDEYTTRNDWGFVPCVQVFNDFDSALNGGVSELEVVYPFLHALHDLIKQTRSVHHRYANPKLKFKLDDVATFIQNNFPEAYVDGKFTGKINWRNNEVLFMESEEDASFVEVVTQSGDSVSLMEFVIDCICMAAEITEAVLFRAKAEGSTTNNDEHGRLKAKITRKRNNFEIYLKTIMQMAMKIGLNAPKRPTIFWDEIEYEDLSTKAQAISNLVSALEVANRAKAISLKTYRSTIRPYLPTMKDDKAETAQVNSEASLEQNQQLDFQKQMSAITGPANNGAGGPNGASRARTRLPMEPVPTQPGQ